MFAFIHEADAGTARHQVGTAFTVALQPFSLDPPSAGRKEVAPVKPEEPQVLRAVAVSAKVINYRPRESAPGAADSQSMESRSGVVLQPFWANYQSPSSTREPSLQSDPDEDYDAERALPSSDSDEDETEQPNGSDAGPIVSGKSAVLRAGIAYAPSQAPQAVKEAIWAANRLCRKPYVWGGGHRSFYDRGYDCSGSISFALHGAGLLGAPVLSDDLMRYGERGRGRWITIYSRSGHTFAVIAGLRFDTTDLNRGGNVGPRWYLQGRDTRGYVARHPVGL